METELLRYGYLFILLGTVVEGDATLLTAAFLAHRGYFRLSLVMAAAGLSTFAASQAYYLTARSAGISWLEHVRRRGPRFEKIVHWATEHGGPMMLASRFLVGFRTLVPIVCGATGMQPARFALWNFAGAAAWTAIFASAGYFGGHILETLIADVRKHEKAIAAVIAVTVAGFILWRTHGRELADAWTIRREYRRRIA